MTYRRKCTDLCRVDLNFDAGLVVAHVSDTSLHHFVTTKKQLKAAGQQPKQQLLQTGQLTVCSVADLTGFYDR